MPKKISVLKTLGSPYSDDEVQNAIVSAQAEADAIAEDLRQNGVADITSDKEIIALIAYLQSLGQLAVSGGAE